MTWSFLDAAVGGLLGFIAGAWAVGQTVGDRNQLIARLERRISHMRAELRRLQPGADSAFDTNVHVFPELRSKP